MFVFNLPVLTEEDLGGGGAATAVAEEMARQSAPIGTEPPKSTPPPAKPAAPAKGADDAPQTLDEPAAGGEQDALDEAEEDEEVGQAFEDLADDELAALVRRHKDRIAKVDDFRQSTEAQIEEEVTRREMERRSTPVEDPEYVRLANAAGQSLNELRQIVQQSVESGEQPSERDINLRMGTYGAFVETKERTGAFSVQREITNALSTQLRAGLEKDAPEAVKKADQLWFEAQSIFDSSARSNDPAVRQKAFGQATIRITRAYGELMRAQGARDERAGAEQKTKDAVALARVAERRAAQAEVQQTAAGALPAAPRRTPTQRAKVTPLNRDTLFKGMDADRVLFEKAGFKI